MPLLQKRRLFLMRGDFRRTAWYQQKQPPPASPAPALVAFDWLEKPSARLPKPMCAPSVASQRFARGGHCLLGTNEGKVVYEIWVMPSGTTIDWIEAHVDLPDGYAMFTGAYTRPDWRGRNAHRHGLALAVQRACDIGRPGVFAGIEEHEVVPHCRHHAGTGLYPLVPHSVLELHRLLRWKWHRTVPPPASLVRACEELIAAQPAHFPPQAAA